MLTVVEPRDDNTFAPGKLYLQNKGHKRTFSAVPGFAEFSMNVVLTDVDGDGKVTRNAAHPHRPPHPCTPGPLAAHLP